MTMEHLIHHTQEGGYASYGRDGGTGCNIMIAPAQNCDWDKAFLENIRSSETSVASVLERQPANALNRSLNSLMTAWSATPTGNLYFFDILTADTLRAEFMTRAPRIFKRQRVEPEKIDNAALTVLHGDICESLDMTRKIFAPEAPLAFLMLYYPPASAKMKAVHEWHDDMRASTEGKVCLNRSLNVDGVKFQFAEQADPETVTGVSLSIGRTMFKIGHKHRAAPVSPTRGRVMYTITGAPAI